MKENSWTDEKKATKDYYDVNDIKEITGKSKSLAYKIIRILQDKFKKDFPDTITIQGLIPSWYFEEQLKNKRK